MQRLQNGARAVSPRAWSEATEPNVLAVAPDLETPGDLTTVMNGIRSTESHSIPEFLSIPHAIDNDFHLRPSLLSRADVHSSGEGGSMPAHPTTVSLRSDAAG